MFCVYSCSCYAAELFSCAVASVTRRRMRVTGPETDKSLRVAPPTHLQPVCQARERLFSCYIRVFLHDEIRCFSCHYICIFLCVFFSLCCCVLYPTNMLISATLLCVFSFFWWRSPVIVSSCHPRCTQSPLECVLEKNAELFDIVSFARFICIFKLLVNLLGLST